MSNRMIAACIAASIALAACGEDAPSSSETVGAMTEVEVPDRWNTFADRASELDDLAGSVCDSGDAAGVLAAVDATRAVWSELRPWWFGPVMDERARFIVDSDVDPREIDELVAGDAPIDADSMRELYGADQRGLGAIDHVASALDPVDPDARACEFVAANATLVRVEADELAAAWSTFGPAQSDSDDVADDAIEAMVNESLFALAALNDETDGAVVDATLLGVRRAMVGDGGEGPDGIAGLLDDDVVERLRSEFDAALADPGPERVMEVEITITTNVVSALGLAIQFSDADGDG